MNHIAIFREGDKDEPIDGYKILPDGKPFKLGEWSETKGFVKTQKNKTTVVFVGFCTVAIEKEIISVFCLPKYFPREKCNLENWREIQQHLKTICKVIERLRSKGKDFSFFSDENTFDTFSLNDSGSKVNRYELAEYLLEDYLQNGLYVKVMSDSRKNGAGKTNWSKTVTKIQPLIQDGTPIYIDLIKKHYRIDDKDLISIIHANVLNLCIDFIGPLLYDRIDHIDTEFLGYDLSSFSSIINARSTYVFTEREINLYKALEAWCSTTKYYKNLAGVTCFNKIWEYVNDAVWGNIKHPESGNPTYHIGIIDYSGDGDAIPDTINIVKESDRAEENEVYIYDSKYYTVNFAGNTGIKGYPPNSDIVKQVAYLKLIKSQFIAASFYNMFLMPEYFERVKPEEQDAFMIEDNKWFSVKGYARPGEFDLDLVNRPKTERSDSDEEKVGIVFVDPNKLYEMLLNNKTATPEDIQETGTYLLKK